MADFPSGSNCPCGSSSFLGSTFGEALGVGLGVGFLDVLGSGSPAGLGVVGADGFGDAAFLAGCGVAGELCFSPDSILGDGAGVPLAEGCLESSNASLLSMLAVSSVISGTRSGIGLGEATGDAFLDVSCWG